MFNSKNISDVLNNDRKNVGFGGGTADLFLQVQEGSVRVLDYEYDSEEIHSICGGRQYYRSRAGLSGAGWIRDYGDLIPVGLYRVDVAHTDVNIPQEVADGITVMLPHVGHEPDKEYLYRHPVVVTRQGDWEHPTTMVYCRLDDILAVVKALVEGKESELGVVKDYVKTFTNTETLVSRQERLNLVNCFGNSRFNPWVFVVDGGNFNDCTTASAGAGNFEWGWWSDLGFICHAESGSFYKLYNYGEHAYVGERVEGLDDETFAQGGEVLEQFLPRNWRVSGKTIYRYTRDGKGVVTFNSETGEGGYMPKILFLGKNKEV
ncbi:MAG: hypothetical protein IKK43_02915 [Clostridia bacterium]|nr:hypothetical protein [Clostridia bacterium]